jgi:hypothetical protein
VRCAQAQVRSRGLSPGLAEITALAGAEASFARGWLLPGLVGVSAPS